MSEPIYNVYVTHTPEKLRISEERRQGLERVEAAGWDRDTLQGLNAAMQASSEELARIDQECEAQGISCEDHPLYPLALLRAREILFDASELERIYDGRA